HQVDACCPGWRDDPTLDALAAVFWPGPLSLVLPAARRLAPGVAASDGTVAIRVTSHPVARDLCLTAGIALVATSANPRGAAPPVRVDEALAGLPADPRLAVLDAGPVAGGRPSTIVRADARPPGWRVVREGAIAAETLGRALREASR
ncbi:MAG: hypothetical protein D6738_15270, partial [Acidobacteria bacterium]